jgi:hypothetical protein
MNDESNCQNETAIDRRPIKIGFACGIAPAILAALLLKTQAAPFLMIFGLSIWPLAAVVAAVLPSSRRFGLGMLLGVGLGWLVMLAICGGLLQRAKPPRPQPRSQNFHSAPTHATHRHD